MGGDTLGRLRRVVTPFSIRAFLFVQNLSFLYKGAKGVTPVCLFGSELLLRDFVGTL